MAVPDPGVKGLSYHSFALCAGPQMSLVDRERLFHSDTESFA